MNLHQDLFRSRIASFSSTLRRVRSHLLCSSLCLSLALLSHVASAAIPGVDGANWSLMNTDLPTLAFSTGFGFDGNGIGIRENRDVYQTLKFTSAETGGAPGLAVDAFWLGYDSSPGAASPGQDRAFTLRLFEVPNALTATGSPPIGGIEVWNSGPTSTQTLGNGIKPAPGFGGVVRIDVLTRQIQLLQGKDYAFQIDDHNFAPAETLAWKASNNYPNGRMVSGGNPQSLPGDVELGISGTPIPEPSSFGLFVAGLVFCTPLMPARQIRRIA